MHTSRIDRRHIVALATVLALALGLVWAGEGTALGRPYGGNNAAAAKQCADWQQLYTSNGDTFDDRGDCVSYAAEGGEIRTEPPAVLNSLEQVCLDNGGTNLDPRPVGDVVLHRCGDLAGTDSLTQQP